MSIYDVNGNQLITSNYKFVGAILGATNEENRFLAMKQLFDIAIRKINNPSYVPSASEFSYATKGAVCILPEPASFYERYPISLLFGKNETTQDINASTTKVLNLITALPYLADIKEKITLVSGDTESGSGDYFSAGDVLTIEDIMYGMLLPSSNTCAKTLAHYCGAKILGNSSASVSDCVSAFITEMNRKATEIGCENSTFNSPSGLSATTKSTAKDLLRITISASSYPEIARIWNKKSYSINIGGTNPRTQAITTTVSNASLEADYYIFGGKTGYYYNSQGNYGSLVMVAEANGA